MRFLAFLVPVSLAALVACGGAKGSPGGPSMNNKIGGASLPPPVSHVVSSDILAREPVATHAKVKHILVSWKDLADNFDGHQDPRASGRSKAEAEAAVDSIVGQLRAGADFDTVMKAQSEDAGSAASGNPIAVSPDAGLVIEFKQLGMRLNVDEIGVCESQFGFHIMKRVE
jgi:PPIC-type PPIASE domain